MTPEELSAAQLQATKDQTDAIKAQTAALLAAVQSQGQFMATLNAMPDGVPFSDVLRLVGMLLRMPVDPGDGAIG